MCNPSECILSVLWLKSSFLFAKEADSLLYCSGAFIKYLVIEKEIRKRKNVIPDSYMVVTSTYMCQDWTFALHACTQLKLLKSIALDVGVEDAA